MRRLIEIGLLLIMLGCSAEIDLPESPEILVVEGWLTDLDTIQQVRLSKTVSFESNSSSTIVDNAIVRVRSLQNTFEYNHISNGIYHSIDPFKGIKGVTYWLEIDLEGEQIESGKEVMRKVPNIDSIYFDFFQRESPINPQITELIYYPIGYFSDDSTQQNFHRWRFKRNNILFSEPEDIFIQEDRFLNGLDTIKNEFRQFEYELNDTIYMEMQEISFDAYDYLRLLKLQTTSLGTRNGTTPGVVRGNMINSSNPSNIILGYFGVISTTNRTKIINP
ncbi:MAG: DUF4249 domain-containing protein [Bacteroidota bacterium]